MEIKVFIVDDFSIPAIYLKPENLESQKHFVRCFRGITSIIEEDYFGSGDAILVNIWVYNTRPAQREELVRRLKDL